jgi:hypothetical protein
MGVGGASPASDKEASGEGRIEEDGLESCATKPPTLRLAAAEAVEQDQNFRVAGGMLADVGEEGYRKGGIEGWPR